MVLSTGRQHHWTSDFLLLLLVLGLFGQDLNYFSLNSDSLSSLTEDFSLEMGRVIDFTHILRLFNFAGHCLESLFYHQAHTL